MRRSQIIGLALIGTLIILALFFESERIKLSKITEWNQTYGGNGYDNARALIQTPDGGFALAGTTDSFGAGESDMWLLKTDANGVAQWSQNYGGNEYDDACVLIQTTDGEFALAGATTSFGDLIYGDMWLVKTKATAIQDIPLIIIFGSFLILEIATLLGITLYKSSHYRS
ncbi:MAG: hypothetical protein ACFFAU_20590 [Candidatus Hodarchaeota archaeon]